MLGSCGLWAPLGWPRSELTWWVIPSARGQGIATEPSKLVIAFANEALGWDCVETHFDDDNEAARRLKLALGGRKIARDEFPDGKCRDVYQFPNTDAS